MTKLRRKPLTGIRVLDLTRLLPGPVCSLHLADMGADVIKIEDPHQGDYARDLGNYYDSVNRNKRSIKLDLKQDAGREIFLRLADTTHVIIEGFRPGTVDRLKIGYQDIDARNPAIVYCSISGYGQTGPYRDHAGHDLNYAGYAGVIDQIGARGGPPVIPNFQIADLLGGSLGAVMGILAALVDAQRSGRGRYVDVAMADCTLAHTVIPLSTSQQLGHVLPRGEDMLSGGFPWYAIYETADARFVALAALEEKFWRRFCEKLDRVDWVADYHADETRCAALSDALRILFKSQTQAYWLSELETADCCFSPVLTLDESLRHPQFEAREMVKDTVGGMAQFAFPVKFSDFQFNVHHAAPRHGEHSEQILVELGYTAREIDVLKQNETV